MNFPTEYKLENRNFQKELTELLETQDKINKKRLLLHCCCAPCSSYVLEYLHPYFDITIFFYNPNITAEKEYIMRKNELKRYLSEVSFGQEISIMDADYEPELFFEAAKGYEHCPERGERCTKCFELRLSETARRASGGAFDYFCTTLSISPHKDAKLLMAIGELCAEEYGVSYLPSDFKKKNGYKRSIELSGEYGLYRQDYCGCVYSRQAKKMSKKLPVGCFILLVCFFCLCSSGCYINGRGEGAETGQTQENSGRVQREIFAMDTIMDLTVYGSHAGEAVEQAVSLIHKLDKTFSVTNSASDIARLNAAEGKAVSVSEDTYELITRCQEISEMTDGLFDISVYPLVKAWGFTTDNLHVPTQNEIHQALAHVDYRKIKLLPENKIQIPENMQLDLGAAAKGYLSQKLMELFKSIGVDSALVSLGGNVQTMGTKEGGSNFVIGITDPSDGASIYGTIKVKDKAVITSGIYQRYFEENGVRYHHIMDRRTGKPAENSLSSVTAICDEGWKADALATALYVMGEEKAVAFQKEHPEIGIILIRKDGSFWQSDGVGLSVE